MDMTTALESIDAWPVDDKIEFVHRVWDRIAVQGLVPPLSEPQRAELERRLEALELRPDDVMTWEAIVDHVRRAR